MVRKEYQEVTFLQTYDLTMDPVCGEVYGIDFSTGTDFGDDEIEWVKAFDRLSEVLQALGNNGWDLVSVTKFPINLPNRIQVYQTFYFQRTKS